MLMHQGIGLDAFNAMPMQKAVHALYECCYSVPLAADLARGRPYADHDRMFRQADSLLFRLSEDSIDTILQAYPHVGRRPRSTKSHAEQCSVWDERPEVMAQLDSVAQRYAKHFGFGFVMFVGEITSPMCSPRSPTGCTTTSIPSARWSATSCQDQSHPAGAHAGTRRRLLQLVRPALA